MRVISGKYKGKKLNGFTIDGTRPTMDRVKESLFGMIQGKVKDSVCLDLFAGSGSLGIEALSNGSAYCYFVENGKVAQNVLKENLTGIDNAEILPIDFEVALKGLQEKNIKFDIVFLDPPYQYHLITKAIDMIIKYNLLAFNGLIICEFENEDIKTTLPCIREKRYGDKNIAIYKLEK